MLFDLLPSASQVQNYYLRMSDTFHQISRSIIIKNELAYFFSYNSVAKNRI